MSLSDIMSNSGLAIYAEIALVIFVVIFIAVVARVLAPSRRRHWDETGQLPLNDDSDSRPTTSAPPHGEDTRNA